MIEHSDFLVDQPGEFKIKNNQMSDSQLRQFLIKRKQDVEKKMQGKKITDFYKVGIIVKLCDDDNLYQIISRFDYSDDYIMYDYKGLLLEENSKIFKCFNHNQIDKAFKYEEQKGGKVK